MQTAASVSFLYSDRFDELRRYFMSIEPPYTLQHIREFNRIYGRIYPVLTKDEKRRAEDFVDALIAGVGRQEWAEKIYGVV
ncbi:MAG: hypothetical protein ACXWUF_21910 [Methylomagnum sp.]